MATDMFGNTIDANGTVTKKKQSPLSLQDPNQQQPVQLSPEAMSGAAAQNNQVLQTAQNQVLNQGQQPSQLQQATTQSALNFVQNPMGDYDPQKTKQAQLDAYNNDWAKAYEAVRRQYGTQSGSGLLQQNMLENVLQHNIDTRKLESDIDQQNYDRYIDSLSKSIAAGQSVGQQNEDIFSQRLGSLATVRGMAEPERAQMQEQANTIDLMNRGYNQDVQKMAIQQGYDLQKLDKSFGNEMATLIAQNDFIGAQAVLDRDLKISLQSNDIKATAANIQKQLDFDRMAMKSSQEFTAVQNSINNALQITLKTMDTDAQQNLLEVKNKLDKGILVQEQDFNAIQNDLDRQLQQAIQSNDFENQKQIIQLKGEIDSAAQQYSQEFTASQNAINNALQITLKTMDTDAQRNLLEIKSKLDKGILTQEQDFTAVQNDLDRQLQQAMQSNDFETQKQLIQLKGDIDSAAQQSQQEFQSAERIATQSWQTDERVSDQSFEQAQKYFDWAQQNAAQERDIEAQTALQTMQNDLQLKMQTQDMDQETKMVYLENELNNATADNDVERQKQIIQYQTKSDLAKIRDERGADEAMAELQYRYNLALQNNDNTAAEALQKSQLLFTAEENAKDRQMQEVEMQLRERGVDLAEQEQQWEQLKQGVETGAISPDALEQYLGTIAEQIGIKIEAPSQVDVYKEAENQMNFLKYQFSLTNPAYVANEVTGELTPDGIAAFNQFYNSAMYGDIPEEGTQINLIKSDGTVGKSITPEQYQNLLMMQSR